MKENMHKNKKIKEVLDDSFIRVEHDVPVEDFYLNIYKKNTLPTVVVTQDGSYYGIIPSLNLIKNLVHPEKMPKQKFFNMGGVDFSYFPKTVKDLASIHQVTVDESETVADVVAVMAKRNLPLVTVMSGDDILGVATIESILLNTKITE